LTIRRGVGLIVTVAVAAYLSARFDEQCRLEVLSLSFALAAVGTVLFVIAFPNDGIMNFRETAGSWRGVFPHKNVLGPAMASALCVELLLTAEQRRLGWRWMLVAFYVFLLVASRSAEAIVVGFLYLLGGVVYFLGTRSKATVTVSVILAMITVYAALLIFALEPAAYLAALGKNSTLSGRTGVWELVTPLIKDRLWLGYGYHAMWAVDDPVTIAVDRAVGGWGVTGAHNGYLEIALQLGLVGLGFMVALILSAFLTAFDAMRSGRGPLGFFVMTYLFGMLLASGAKEMLGQNQTTEWLMFNVFLFSCQLATARKEIGEADEGKILLPSRRLDAVSGPRGSV
jgi:O-antigen ligase